MKRETLRLVRRLLKAKTINPDTFCFAVNAILTLAANRTPPWRRLVESAFQKLSKRGQRKARPMMLFFYAALDDQKAAAQFIPRRFTGPSSAVEMMYAMGILLDLNRIDESRSIVRKATRTVGSLTNSYGRAMLIDCIATYMAKTHEWEKAIRLWEQIQDSDVMAENAIFGLLDLHLERTLLTIKSARSALARLRQTPNPEAETILPGNDAARWREAEAKLDKIERVTKRALKAAGNGAPD